MNIDTEKDKRLKSYLTQHPNIIFLDTVLGGYNFEVEIQVKDEAVLRLLMINLREKFSDIIREYDILKYYQEYRLRFFPSS